MKKNPKTAALNLAVAVAEKAAADKAAELNAAKEVVARLQREHSEALDGIRLAREAADAVLPQCSLVAVKWRSGKVENIGRGVILRKTAGGQLVVRRFGSSGGEMRFKFSAHRGAYSQVEKSSFYGSDRRELRDVPTEYNPTPDGAGVSDAR